MTVLPFDRVQVRYDDRTEELDVAQFRELRLNRRVRLLLENRISFFQAREEISAALALRSLAEKKALPRANEKQHEKVWLPSR